MKPSFTAPFACTGRAPAPAANIAETVAVTRTRAVPAASLLFDIVVIPFEFSGCPPMTRPVGALQKRQGPDLRRPCVLLELGTTPHDQRDDLGVGLGARNELADLAPAAHDDGAVRDLHDVIHRMRDDDHGLLLLAESQDQIEHTARLAHAERSRRLVEDHDARCKGGGTRDGDALPLATREKTDRAVVVERDLQSLERSTGRVDYLAAAQDPDRPGKPARPRDLAAG